MVHIDDYTDRNSHSAAAEIARGLKGRSGSDGKSWNARCPAHDDRNPSLSITDGPNGTVLVKCHAGCAQEAVIDALRNRGLWPLLRKIDGAKHLIEYIYRDEVGEPYLRVRRIDMPDGSKTYPQARWEGGKWVSGKPRGHKIPYRLPELIKAPVDTPVFIVEGEKCADALAMHGFVATTASEGAGKWNDPALNAWFKERAIYVLPDNDKPGAEHATQVAEALRGVAKELRIVGLPGLEEGEDVYDWLRGDVAAEDLLVLAERAPIYGPPKPIIATPFVLRKPELIPVRQWLYGRHTCRRFLSVTAAPGGGAKTSHILADLMTFATGRNLLGDQLRGSGRVWYIGLEDPREEYDRRLTAIAKYYGIQQSELDGRFFLDTGREQDFVIAREEAKGLTIIEPVIDAILCNIREKQIDVVAVDPFVDCHTIPESDNTKINHVAKQWAKIAELGNCGLDLAHHVRKGTGLNGDPTADDVRGAGALTNASRSVRMIVRMTKEEAKVADIEETDRWRYFRLVDPKANMAPPSADSRWRKLESVSLGNGPTPEQDDNVGVVVPWKWPSVFADVGPSDLEAIREKVAHGDWRRSPKADNWVGKAVAAVLELDPADKHARADIEKMLKVWVANGTLKVASDIDPKTRKKRDYVRVGSSDPDGP